ncbi:50S ribosomal protein L10 [Paenibacillus sp. N4]|nr:50S ribosomal protein L10 [Paenibacillus vietnamensis]
MRRPFSCIEAWKARHITECILLREVYSLANANIIQSKQQAVQEIAAKIAESSSTVVADYRGLNVAQVTELRKQLREAGIEFQVLKNSLVRRATEGTDYAALNDVLTGPTAVAFGKADAVAPAKILNDFAKKNDALKLKGGIVEGKVVSMEEVKALAELPSREGLLSMLLSVLQAPIRNFALAVKAVGEKQEQEA